MGSLHPKRTLKAAGWMSHAVTWATTDFEHGIMRSLTQASLEQRMEPGSKGWYHECQEGAVTHSLYSMGKGTPRTDRVPIAIPSGFYSKPPNGREQEPYSPSYSHIQPCTHCVEYEPTGDTTNGWKNGQTPWDFSRKEVPKPLWGRILPLVTDGRVSPLVTDAGGDGFCVGLSPPFSCFSPRILPLPIPSPGGLSQTSRKPGRSYGKHTAADHKCQQC